MKGPLPPLLWSSAWVIIMSFPFVTFFGRHVLAITNHESWVCSSSRAWAVLVGESGLKFCHLLHFHVQHFACMRGDRGKKDYEFFLFLPYPFLYFPFVLLPSFPTVQPSSHSPIIHPIRHTPPPPSLLGEALICIHHCQWPSTTPALHCPLPFITRPIPTSTS